MPADAATGVAFFRSTITEGIKRHLTAICGSRRERTALSSTSYSGLKYKLLLLVEFHRLLAVHDVYMASHGIFHKHFAFS
jgi:hypothetical protein